MTQLIYQGHDLEAKLRDTTWRLQQLQTQYDYLASKSATQNLTYKNSEEQIEVLVIFGLSNEFRNLIIPKLFY